MIEASAPGRCGIVGNPTDGYGGSVLSAAIAERARVCVQASDRFRLEICGEKVELRGRDEIRLDGGYTRVAQAVLTAYPEALEGPPFRLHGSTSVPIEAGLSGSTAMLVAVLAAILRLLGRDMNPYALAEEARRIEFDVMGTVCGFQDQYLCVFGGLRFADFRDKSPRQRQDAVFGTVEPLEPPASGLPLLLANTGVRRHSGSVHGGLRERWLAGDREVIQGYERIARLAREGKTALIRRDWHALAALMNENHRIQRDLGGSGEANERLIAAAMDAGALAAKLAGAGKGGTIIALHEDIGFLARRLQDAGAERIMPVTLSEGVRCAGHLD